MQAVPSLKLIVVLPALIVGLASSPAHAQERRGGGVRVGAWNVDVEPWMDRSPHFEGYIQRGLADDLALENSIGVWRAVVNQTKAYVVPLMTSLKFYPVTDPERHRFEPYVVGGLGFAFGVQDQDETAVGGDNSTLVTGIGFRVGIGVEVRVINGFGLAASGKYQWIHFGEEVGTMETFHGVGVEGAVFYRVSF